MDLQFASTVKPDLTTTCEQRPPVNNGQFKPSTASLNVSFIRHLCQTAAFFRPQGWPLYTGLTVFNCHMSITIFFAFLLKSNNFMHLNIVLHFGIIWGLFSSIFFLKSTVYILTNFFLLIVKSIVFYLHFATIQLSIP